jgi:radical SAM superfamily enzyme YgiQ (UPF0313 family)
MRLVFADNLLIRQEGSSRRFDLQPHLGLLSLLATAERAGIECCLFDPKLEMHCGALALEARLYGAMAERLLALRPDVIGLTSLGCNFICAAKVASHLKSLAPEVPIILGGPHATILHHEIMARFRQFDIVVRKEAEPTLLPLLESLPSRQLKHIEGITYREGEEVIANPGAPIVHNLDNLPFGAYHHYPIEELQLTTLRVEAGRGCPFECTFCSTASFFGRTFRLKSPARLCAELDFLHARYGISDFSLMHDLFTVNKAKVRAFCDEVEGRKYTWSCSARMDCVDTGLLEQMRAAGCCSIYYGVETGSVRMQRISAKRMDLSLVLPILAVTRRIGIKPTLSFITGFPEEQIKDQEDTLDLIASCFLESQDELDIQLHLLTPEPGTALHRELARSLAYDGHVSDFNFPTLEPDDGEVLRQAPDVFMNHHYYPSAVPRSRNVLVTTSYALLHRLGRPALRHVLACYEGKLSQLMERMVVWAEENGWQPPFNFHLIESFFAAEWGPDHYLSSLTRYTASGLSLLAGDLSELPDRRSGTLRQGLKSDGRLRLSQRATVLRNLHDCPEILRRLTGGERLPKTLWTQRGSLLLQAQDNGFLRNFAISEGLADLVELFHKPRTLKECMTQLQSDVDGGEAVLQAAVGELVHFGILEIEANRRNRARRIASSSVSRSRNPNRQQRAEAGDSRN